MSEQFFPNNTAMDSTNSSHSSEIEPKRIGTILREADLVSLHQLDLALKDQVNFPNLRLGEILAMRGWIKSETADFFVRDWSKIITEENRQPLGHYLVQSALLKPEEIEIILEEQRSTGIRFGTIAVMQGLLKSTTLDFFLMNLFPRESAMSPFASMYGTMSLDPSSEESEYLPSVLFEEWDKDVLNETES